MQFLYFFNENTPPSYHLSDNDTDNSDKNKKPRQNKISPNQLENLLKAMDNEEKNVLKKVNKNKMKGKPIKNKKDW